jgi:phosphopantothenoylcysteine decarboxylase
MMSNAGEKPFAGKTVVLGVTGSIAAYKAADLTSMLVKQGAQVFPVLTASGERFIPRLTLQTLARNPVSVNLWEEGEGEWKPGHIDLADRADLLLVVPASASTLARFAHGLADDLLTCIYLATRAPVAIAPAMNGKMWAHPATVNNVNILKERGHYFVNPSRGMLACGYEGEGKLAPLESILEEVGDWLTKQDGQSVGRQQG